MRRALELARRAQEEGEVPVGAVVVSAEGVILGLGHNLRETDADPSAHAELLAMRHAAQATRSWRLEGATVFVTLEPCVMCAGAMVNARIARLVYGCDDPKAGACGTLYSIGEDTRLNHRFPTVRGVLEGECADRLKRFFAALRVQSKSKK